MFALLRSARAHSASKRPIAILKQRPRSRVKGWILPTIVGA